MDQRDQDAWLEGLAARVDAGEPIDWEAEEQRVGPDGRHVVRALRIVAEIAAGARRSDGDGTIGSRDRARIRTPPDPARG